MGGKKDVAPTSSWLTDPKATLISGGLSLGGSLIAGILNYISADKANDKAYKLAMLQRADELAAQKANLKLAKQGLALQTRQQAWTEEEAAKTRAEQTEERGYGRLQNAYQRGAQLFADSMNLLQAKTAPFMRRAA